MAARNPSDTGKSSASYTFSKENIVVLEDIYVIDHSGKIPSIKFLDRVHEQIDKSMRNTMIVCLLGRSIGFKILHARLLAIWKLIGNIQLIDLENGYFFVWFEKKSDYSMVLIEWLWTIYGCYLTVQPWSHDFSTTEKHPSHVVVWIWLSGLPYHYYSKALFIIIATVVDCGVRIDYNTLGGARGRFVRLVVMIYLQKPLSLCVSIDGRIQKLEYEGLYQICYNCGTYGHSKEAYGATAGTGSVAEHFVSSVAA
ncbi:hypothetical protein GQ457_17G013960 [Hibiscus cannabinus]